MIKAIKFTSRPPTDGAEHFDGLLLQAQRFRNDLIDVARKNRAAYFEARRERFPALAAADDAYQAARAAREAAEEEIKAERFKQRSGKGTRKRSDDPAFSRKAALARIREEHTKAPNKDEFAAAEKAALARIREERTKDDPIAALRVAEKAALTRLKEERAKVPKGALPDIAAAEQAAEKAVAIPALGTHTAYLVRKEHAQRKQMGPAQGPNFVKYRGTGRAGVQVIAQGMATRHVLAALKAADVSPAALDVLPVCKGRSAIPADHHGPAIVLVMGQPHWLAPGADKLEDLTEGLRRWRDGDGAAYRTYSEDEAERLVTDLPPLKTWGDLCSGRLSNVSLRMCSRSEWWAAQPTPYKHRHSPPVEGSGIDRRCAWGLLSIRIGGDANQQVVVFPVRIAVDRLPADDVQVKEVICSRRRLGEDNAGKPVFAYSVIVSIDDGHSRQTARPTQKPGAVALNVGWRLRPDGSVRAGYWVGSDGERGEICVPKSLRDRLAKADDLRRIIDERFDLAKARLAVYLATLAEPPPWLTEATQHLAKWRGPERMRRLLATWAERRIAGDEEIWKYLAGPMVEEDGQDVCWRAKDAHLRAWAQRERGKALGHRQHLYRCAAKRLAERYGVLLLEQYNLSEQRRRPRVDEGTAKERSPLIKQMNEAAPGELRDCCRQAFVTRGGQVVEQEVPLATQRCYACGSEERWDAAESVIHTCRQCGVLVDQDEQNDLNRLGFFLKVPPANLV